MDRFTQSAPDLLTRQETAQRLRISCAALDNWTRAARGPAPTRIGGRVFFRSDEIERFLNERTGQAGAVSGSELSGIIASELVERSTLDSPFARDMLEATATLAQAIRKVDLNIRDGCFTEKHARAFVSAVESLLQQLYELGGTEVVEGALAYDIAQGALRTAADLFPHLLPADLRP